MQQENRNLEGQEQDRIGTDPQPGTQQPASNPAKQQEQSRPAETSPDETGESNTQKDTQKETGPNRQQGL